MQVFLEEMIGTVEFCKMSETPPYKTWDEKQGKEIGFLGKGTKIV